MHLSHGHHLAYCTNIHPAETWPETLAALENFTLAVRARVCPDKPFAIGLRLSDEASRQLSEPREVLQFQRWLERNNCYVFTINGFPFGRFHGTRVKEQVYLPDWTSCARVDYTNRLFDLLAQLLPDGVEGSVSTVPGSFKEFGMGPERLAVMRANIFNSVKHIAALSAKSGRTLHLGLEPEPLGAIENSAETGEFFERMREDFAGDERISQCLGVNYDTCHLAVEFEVAAEALARLRQAGVRVSKIHLSSAMKLKATARARQELVKFADATYLHQVIARGRDGKLTRYRDLSDALSAKSALDENEARVHFHIPLHAPPQDWFDNTTDHLCGVLDALQADPKMCSHLEMETYTWGVLPPEMKSRSVVDQLAAEYDWCLGQLRSRGLA